MISTTKLYNSIHRSKCLTRYTKLCNSIHRSRCLNLTDFGQNAFEKSSQKKVKDYFVHHIHESESNSRELLATLTLSHTPKYDLWPSGLSSISFRAPPRHLLPSPMPQCYALRNYPASAAAVHLRKKGQHESLSVLMGTPGIFRIESSGSSSIGRAASGYFSSQKHDKHGESLLSQS